MSMRMRVPSKGLMGCLFQSCIRPTVAFRTFGFRSLTQSHAITFSRRIPSSLAPLISSNPSSSSSRAVFLVTSRTLSLTSTIKPFKQFNINVLSQVPGARLGVESTCIAHNTVRFMSRRARESRGLKAIRPIKLELMERISLNMLCNVPGATRQRIRVGRGRSGRRGKTSGRGHKGTGQHGSSLPFWFQGGQKPLWQIVPKRGKPGGPSVKYVPLNLSKLIQAIEAGKLDTAYPINLKHLWEARVVTGSYKAIGRDRYGVKLLASGAEKLDFPINLEVQRASQAAIKAVEAAGGTIQCKYYNKLGLRALMMPHKFTTIPRTPMPIPKLRMWYSNPENRGVLPAIEESDETVEA